MQSRQPAPTRLLLPQPSSASSLQTSSRTSSCTFGVAEGRHSITEQQASGALRRSLLDFKRKASDLPPVPACACPRGSSTWFNFVSSVQGFVFSVPRTFLLAGNRREGHHDRENYHASLLAHPIASNCSLKQHLRKKPGRNGPLPHFRSTPRQSVCQSVSLSGYVSVCAASLQRHRLRCLGTARFVLA